MSIFLFAIASITFYTGSKYFPSDLYPKLSSTLSNRKLAIALGWTTLVLGCALEIWKYGSLSGVLVSFFVYTTILSFMILLGSLYHRVLPSILALSLFVSIIYQFS